MLKGNRSIDVVVENDHLLKECVQEINKVRKSDSDVNDRLALKEIMRGISNLSSIRSTRAVCVNRRTPPSILIMLSAMSLAILLYFFDQPSSQVSMNYLYILLLPTLYTSIFTILLDLSAPFDGCWTVKLDSMTGVRRWLVEEIERLKPIN